MFHGRYTANGEIYDMNSLTAAHPTLPLPTYARVTNLQNGRSLVVRVNDRGPYAHDRIIDMSRRSAQALGFQRNGTAKVRVQYLGRAPLDGNDKLERRVFASQPWARTASLKQSGGGKQSRTRLAQAVQQEMQADPMVVGSIPKEDETNSQAASWTTNARAASAPKIPDARQRHFIQVASFRNKDFAETLRLRLASMGPISVLPADVAGKTWYRVRLGPYGKRHDADEVLRAVVSSGSADARIVKN
jgi:rare lipoprotein A